MCVYERGGRDFIAQKFYYKTFFVILKFCSPKEFQERSALKDG